MQWTGKRKVSTPPAGRGAARRERRPIGALTDAPAAPPPGRGGVKAAPVRPRRSRGTVRTSAVSSAQPLESHATEAGAAQYIPGYAAGRIPLELERLHTADAG